MNSTAAPAPGASGPSTYEPYEDLDPTPDYENVLTDWTNELRG